MSYKFIALGLGQCSSVLPFLKNTLDGLDYDEIIFCDTGNEAPMTYEHLKIMQNLFEITVLDTSAFFVKPHPPFCTTDTKILPIRRYLRSKGINKAIKFLGYTVDELNRKKENSVKWIKTEYPLIDLEMTRKQCQKFLLDNLGYVPPRSGCINCPYYTRPILITNNSGVEQEG
ncbi:MAG: hypothetical protein ACTSPO_15165 [Candidatus Heimdallarchaeaceae archaeon]